MDCNSSPPMSTWTKNPCSKPLTKAGVDITSGYWHFAKAITPILPIEHYQKVKALLLEQLKRRLEFE